MKQGDSGSGVRTPVLVVDAGRLRGQEVGAGRSPEEKEVRQT